MSETVVPNLVGGEFVLSSSGAVIDVLNPATDGELVGRVPAMNEVDLDGVFSIASASAQPWRRLGPLERGRILLDAARGIRERSGELTDVIVAEMGKTRPEAQGEVGKAAEFFEYYGGLGREPLGQLLPDARPGTFSVRVDEPLGVVVLITPWNDPLLTPARKMAPALLAGNTVVIKPATETPIIALKLAEILHHAGLPAGVLGTVTGRGSDIGNTLTADSRIAAISFTGSTSVGLDLQRRLAGSGVRIQTEMGGKNASVVLDDADLDLATSVITTAAFAQAGQRCTSTSRLIVQRGIAEEFEARVKDIVIALRVGPGADEGTQMGPVVSVSAQREIEASLDRGLSEGGTIIARPALSSEWASIGAFVAPSFISVERTNSLWRDEIFGPVLSMIVVDTLDDAIEAVNDSRYGLSSAIFTRSLESAHRFIAEADTGQVSVNQPTSGWDVHQPFGGFKDSGSSFKEQGLDALRFYTRVKTAAIRTH